MILVDDLHVERARDLVLTDSFNLVRHTLDLDRPVAAPVFGQDRPHRIARDHANRRIPLLEVAPDARDGAAGAGGSNEVRDPSAGLLPDLGSRGGIVGLGIGGL